MRDRQRDADQGGEQDQDGRVDQPVTQHLGDGLLRCQRVAERPVQETVEPAQVLLDLRAVQVELVLQRGQSLRRRVATEDRPRGVAERLRRDEDQDRDQPQHQQTQQQSPDDEGGDSSRSQPGHVRGAGLSR